MSPESVWSHELRGWVFTPRLSERRFGMREYITDNCFMDWFEWNDVCGFFREAAD